jgi:hypothetical protein
LPRIAQFVRVNDPRSGLIATSAAIQPNPLQVYDDGMAALAFTFASPEDDSPRGGNTVTRDG